LDACGEQPDLKKKKVERRGADEEEDQTGSVFFCSILYGVVPACFVNHDQCHQPMSTWPTAHDPSAPYVAMCGYDITAPKKHCLSPSNGWNAISISATRIPWNNQERNAANTMLLVVFLPTAVVL
jgi:hypothetical protein